MDDDRAELAQVIAEEVSAQWNRVVAVIERADPGFVEGLPEDMQFKATGVGSTVMFRFDLEEGGVILCEASKRRVLRATIGEEEVEVEVLNAAGRRIDTYRQPGADFDPNLN